MSSLDTEFLHFYDLPSLGKTRRIAVQSIRHGAHLGDIHWFGRWRQYVFAPVKECVFNTVCLTDIAGHVHDLNVQHRAALAAGKEKP